MIQVTLLGNGQPRYVNPAFIMEVGTFKRRRVIPAAGGGSTYDEEDGGEMVNYLHVRDQDLTETVETPEEILFLKQAWENRSHYSGSSLALSVSLGARYGAGKPSPYYRHL